MLNDGLLGDSARMMKFRISLYQISTIPDHGVFLAAATKLFAECAMQFLLSGPTHSTPVDFSKRNLIGIGHSFGGTSL